MQEFCSQVLVALGVVDNDAQAVAKGLVRADLRGVPSHGVMRLPVYARRLKAGAVNPKPTITPVCDKGAMVVWDADNGLGIPTGIRAMQVACKRAEQYGVGWVGVRRSNHFGMACLHAEVAVDLGMIGIAMSNAPSNVAPWGGREPRMGTNPLGVGLPGIRQPPMMLDMATSIVARGKLMLAAAEGRPIPDGWALDARGRPTTDPHAGLDGSLLPFGGAKGAAIAQVIDALCGVITGASFLSAVGTLDEDGRAQDLSHAFISLDPAVVDGDRGRYRLDAFLEELRATAPAEGTDRVVLAGDLEREREAAGNDVAVGPGVARTLIGLADQLGVVAPPSLREP